jgi:ABC-type nitrate/sulfonate/bicarbonate transport system substrate-binding protein
MKKIQSLALALALALLVLASCAPKPPAEAEPAAPLRAVTLVLDYLPNTNHTGFYAALELGLYLEAGLDVQIIEPADNAVTTLIAAGQGDFGISYQEDVTYAKTAETPLPIKAIATIIQHNTSGFASYTEKNIRVPRDFEGKTYAGWGSPAEEAVISAVMKADGGDPAALNYVVSDGSGYGALLKNVDIMWFFWAWDGIMAERAGVPVNYLELAAFDERLDYYTPVIIASEDKLSGDPELVRDFLAATALGYEYAVENPELAAGLLYKYAPEYALDMLVESQTYLAGKYIDDAARWGAMRDEVWDGYTEFMAEYGLIGGGVPASELYTNEFLPG